MKKLKKELDTLLQIQNKEGLSLRQEQRLDELYAQVYG